MRVIDADELYDNICEKYKEPPYLHDGADMRTKEN